MYKRLAGIITFNPEEKLLSRCIDSISKQVDQIVIVDNGSDDRDYLKSVCCNDKITVIFNKNNEGVSKALNVIMNYGMKNGFTWCLLLDQDSVYPKDGIKKYDRYIELNDCSDVGILCPQIYDRNEKNTITPEGVERVPLCINSGSYINIDIWNKLDGYDEKLFIDLIDYDYATRINESGYKIFRLNDVVLEHSIGNITVHRYVGKVYNHSAMRKFYMAEASVYLSRKHRAVRKKYKYLQHVYLRSLKRGLLVIGYEDNKILKINAIINGIKSGRKISRGL